MLGVGDGWWWWIVVGGGDSGWEGGYLVVQGL